MAFRSLAKLFTRSRPPAEGRADDGPLALGDEVEHYDRSYAVAGEIGLPDGRRIFLLSGGEGPAVLVHDARRETPLSLETAVAEPPPEADEFEREGRRYVKTLSGRGVARAAGEVPDGRRGRVDYVEYDDEDGIGLLTVERWADGVEVRRGAFVYEGELTIRRAGEERFEVRPPPRVDAVARNEARRAREAAAAAAESEADQPSIS